MTSPLNIVQSWSFDPNISLSTTSEQKENHFPGQLLCASKQECGHDSICKHTSNSSRTASPCKTCEKHRVILLYINFSCRKCFMFFSHVDEEKTSGSMQYFPYSEHIPEILTSWDGSIWFT